MTVPAYLRDHADVYADDPREANRRWFREARYGLFLHYGLYALLGRNEWVQFHEKIRPDAYAQLADSFTADRFDADAIADLAVDCGMRYVNLTTRHHDSFCLFKSAWTKFNSVDAAPCGRDLVGELAAACDRRGLGLFLYYSHGRDWKHPHAPNNDQYGGSARPAFDPPERTYAVGVAHDLSLYLRFVAGQIRELLTQYDQPIAGIWLDGIATPLHPLDADGNVIEGYDPRSDGDPFACQHLYEMIHDLSPHALVSYKQGYLGTEDFFAPEHKAHNRFGESFEQRLGEICTTAGGDWGFTAGHGYCTADELWEKLTDAGASHCNLLMNVGPLPDGSLPDEARGVLLEVGRRLQAEGYPGRGD